MSDTHAAGVLCDAQGGKEPKHPRVAEGPAYIQELWKPRSGTHFTCCTGPKSDPMACHLGVGTAQHAEHAELATLQVRGNATQATVGAVYLVLMQSICTNDEKRPQRCMCITEMQ